MIKNNINFLIFFLGINCYASDTPKVTTYLSLSTECLDLSRPVPSSEEYAFFRHYVSKSRGPILEPMCGSGRYLIPLLEEGFKVEGVDASPFMLNALRAKCLQKNISPCVWENFLELMPVTKQYNLIFIPDTSLCFFSELDHIKKILKKIYSLLLPGGIFVFDVQTIHSRWGEIGVWNGQAYKTSSGNLLIESTLPMPINDSVSPLLMRYELVVGSEVVKTEIELYPARLYKDLQMDNLLKEAGFKKIKKIKAHDHKKVPSNEDEVVVYECSK